jgi:hypothetical protein
VLGDGTSSTLNNNNKIAQWFSKGISPVGSTVLTWKLGVNAAMGSPSNVLTWELWRGGPTLWFNNLPGE